MQYYSVVKVYWTHYSLGKLDELYWRKNSGFEIEAQEVLYRIYYNIIKLNDTIVFFLLSTKNVKKYYIKVKHERIKRVQWVFKDLFPSNFD